MPSEAQMAFYAARAAVHHANGATMREAIWMALADEMALWTEMAQNKTPRAQAMRKAAVRELYYTIRGEKDPGAQS